MNDAIRRRLVVFIIARFFRFQASPPFSQAFYCGVGYGHVYGVALGRAPRHTVKYACGALRRAPRIHARLRRLATKSCEKGGLGLQAPRPEISVDGFFKVE